MWWKQQGARELRALLMEAWDPIQVADVPEAADEYDGYMPQLARKLREGATPEDIAAYLDAVEVDMMGMDPLQRNTDVGERIVRWYANSIGDFAKPSY
jgi:hypothetical protein